MWGAGGVHPGDDAALDPGEAGEERFVAVQLDTVVAGDVIHGSFLLCVRWLCTCH